MYVRLFEHPNVVLTRPSSTPAMSSGAQRQVPEFTAGRLSHRNPHGSHRSTRGSSQILCRVIGSRSYERGMLGDHTYVVFSFFFQAVWKRRISIFRRTGKIDKTVHELSQYLDTFYTDVEGWLELADIYASSNQYASIPMTRHGLTSWPDTNIPCNRSCMFSCSHHRTHSTCCKRQKQHTRPATSRSQSRCFSWWWI